jgi:hypothetical protein
MMLLRNLWQEFNIMTNLALVHSTACRDLIEEGRLEDALAYCENQGVAPPFSPCVQGTPEYDQCVQQAMETLSDYGWWEKRLKLKAARQPHNRELARRARA